MAGGTGAGILLNGFVRLKGFHLLCWLLLSLLILLIYYDPAAPVAQQWLVTVLVTAMCAAPAYYGANRLVPRLLYRKRIGAFCGALLLAAALNAVLMILVASPCYYALTGRVAVKSPLHAIYFWVIFFITNSIVIIVSCAVRIITDSFRMEAQLQHAEHEQLRTELDFLRAQVNPHFLFNVLNTIYFQIRMDNDEARGSVSTLSQLLRYQLYECISDRGSIVKEIFYIENYVAMQRLRTEPGTDVRLDLQHSRGDDKIAPLLVLPLIENAFKYISHHKNPADNKLHIALNTGNGQLSIRVFNTCDAAPIKAMVDTSGGVGLRNVHRRLKLLYPGAHTLHIVRGEGFFETTLNIRLS